MTDNGTPRVGQDIVIDYVTYRLLTKLTGKPPGRWQAIKAGSTWAFEVQQNEAGEWEYVES